MKWILPKLSLLLLGLFPPEAAFSQELVAKDSTATDRAVVHADSASTDTSHGLLGLPSIGAKRDSSATSSIQPADVGIDAVVEYSARTIDSRQGQGIIYLTGDAQVKYRDITIKAGKITIKQNENLLIAEGVPDTSNGLADSLYSRVADSTKIEYKDFPVFADGNEIMVGERMEFNFKSQKGRIIRGRTEFQKGHYFGDAVKRIDPKVFFVANGSYTTCDQEEPHFQFKGKKMKVIADDKVLAKPVIFFIGKIPLAIFPFAMFPTQENGRQSGIILPQYGSSPTEGRYLRNLGYYWATNEYMDLRLTMDFFEKSGFLFRSQMNYALRYRFSGSVSGSFTNKSFGDRKERSWNLRVQHSQTIDQNTSLSVNGSFQSSNNFYRDFSNNRQQRLRRQIISNATFRKRWGEGKNSIDLNLSQTKDLESGSTSRTLPRLRYTRSRGAIIPFKEDKRGRKKGEPKWYNLIQYDYKGLLENRVRTDTTSNPDDITRKVEHDINLSFTSPGKLFGVLSLTQSFKYDEDWFDRRAARYVITDSSRNKLEAVEEKGFFQRRLFRYSASASTNLFGTFRPNIFSITGFRHKMSPSISFSFRPDFSDADRWGYFVTATDTAGRELTFDRYSGTPRGKQMSMGFNLNNLFQMKLGKGEKEKKIDLFNLNFSSGYNFAADSLKLRNLATSFRANPRRNFNVSMSLNHSFYRFDQASRRTVDEFISPRLTSFRLDARWSLSGSKKAAGAASGRSPSLDEDEEAVPFQRPRQDEARASGLYRSDFDPESAFSALDIPWRANLSFSYSISKANPDNPIKNAYLDLSNVELQLTRKWRIGYRLRYDLTKTKVVDQRISFYRDLHCWEARFDWNPSGIGKGYYFIINIKAPHLHDIKIENRGGATSVLKSPF
ncbi:MAG: putative LPS assembly protein LptD [bacterium]